MTWRLSSAIPLLEPMLIDYWLDEPLGIIFGKMLMKDMLIFDKAIAFKNVACQLDFFYV